MEYGSCPFAVPGVGNPLRNNLCALRGMGMAARRGKNFGFPGPS
jgi:hypothetical protein